MPETQAFIRKTSFTQRLRCGDVIKCIVIETRNDRYNWRAYPYTNMSDPSANIEDRVETYTNELMENKNGIEIIQKIDFQEMKLNSTKKIKIWIK